MSLSRVFLASVCLVGLLAGASPSWAQVVPYSQDFDSLALATDPSNSALSDEGWVVFANVFDNAGGGFLYSYGGCPCPAPNRGAGPGFSAVVAGEGGSGQGARQLSIFNDYNNPDHGNNRTIEAIVFREQTVVAADVGKTYRFVFDAKLGNLEGATTANAFIKTINNVDFSQSSLAEKVTTGLPSTWGTFGIELTITPGLVGHFLQFGFSSRATAFQGSGVFYDNVYFGVCDANTVIANGVVNTRQSYAASNSATVGPDLIVEAGDPGVDVDAPSVVFDGSNAGVVLGSTFKAANRGCGAGP